MKTFSLQKPPLTFLYSFFGIVFVQGFYNFPIVMKNVSESWSRISTERADAARLLGAGNARVFFTVTLNQILPSIFSSAIIVFLFCFFSFLIVLLFGPARFSTLEVELYQRAQNLSQPKMAVAVALCETFVALSFVAAFAILEKKGERNTSSCGPRKNVKKISDSSAAEIILFSIFAAAVLLCFVLPFFMIFRSAFIQKNSGFSVENFIWIFKRKSFPLSLLNTVRTGFLSALASTLIGTSASLFFFNKRTRTAAKIISFVPMAVSPVVVGFLCLVTFRRGSPAILVFAQSILYWPYAFRQILNSMEKIPREIRDGAALVCRNPVVAAVKVHVPLSKMSIISSFFFCFALSSGDAALPLVLGIPRFSTLALDTFRFAGAYRFSHASASGAILFLLTGGLYILSGKIKNIKK